MKLDYCFSKFIVLGLFSFILLSCQPDTEAPIAIEVRPEFEQQSPIADSIFVQQTDEGSFKLIAHLEDERLLEPLFAMNIGEEIIILRDDGLGADDLALDGNYTFEIPDSIATQAEVSSDIKRLLDNASRKLKSSSNNPAFSNRSVAISHAKSLVDTAFFDLEVLQTGRKIFLPADIFRINTDPDPALKDHSLMITDLNVVEDVDRTFNPCTNVGNPNGVWTFGELMRQLASPSPSSIANDQEVSAFVLNWLNSWTSAQTINSETIDPRTSIQNTIIDPWIQRSQANGAPSGELLMQFAPFKLMAIVNRLDLRGNSAYGFSDAGEGRFVFCALNDNCQPLQFTVIFEYGINKKSCAAVQSFAQSWYELKDIDFVDPQFNVNLQAITDQFTRSGTNPSKPNQSSLNQLRTNEIALGNPWELREFILNAGGSLISTTVKQEPAVSYNSKLSTPEVQRLADYVNAFSTDICDNNYTVPEVFQGEAFLGAKSHTIFPPTGNPTPAHDNIPHHWDAGSSASGAVIIDNCARHVFSLNTCSGCHGGESQTFFTHIDPAPFGTPAELSGFLTGLGPDASAVDNDTDPNGFFFVMDAAFRPSADPEIRGFNDLKRRAEDLEMLVNETPCLGIGGFFLAIARALSFRPLNMTH